jgi:hypothetical protein
VSGKPNNLLVSFVLRFWEDTYVGTRPFRGIYPTLHGIARQPPYMNSKKKKKKKLFNDYVLNNPNVLFHSSKWSEAYLHQFKIWCETASLMKTQRRLFQAQGIHQ